jgi:signal transduction histidine kinase
MPNTKGRSSAGGRRGPSIRTRIYFLVAIPLLTVIGLYAFVLYTTVGDAINLRRAPALINETSVPAATFDTFVQDERKASLVYLAAPTAANRAQLVAAQTATAQAFPSFHAKMTSPATTQAATTSETQVINGMLADIGALSGIRDQVNARAISPDQIFGAYSRIITDELHLFLQENASLTDISAATQSMAVIDTTEARESLLQEDALISAAIAAHQLAPATRVQFTQLAGARKVTIANGLSRLHPGNLAAFQGPLNQAAPPAMQDALTTLENAVAGDPTPFPPFTANQWSPVAKAVAAGYFNGGVNASEYEVGKDTQTTRNAFQRVALSGGLGLLGLLLSVVVSTMIGRRIIRRLRRLREVADTLANEQLPDVVARLRRGEDVPVEQMVGQTTTGLGRDEIGQVGQAFDAARQTAIEAAVGEARMRRGISDVFRNLARRNQSLLHRQLTSLDQMERRTTDPETLEDLFRLDHLTTRMRRHSEGLIILSGAAPGRGWVHPVRMVDVLRGAAAEVEDYSRVTVTCPSQAALQGPAVADVIHLLAELIENATTLSPPYTPVRVSGDLVANGFAIEIEDRGLGMSEQRFAELNARLAEPPEFDVFHSEQLGLFVVGQLAKRHHIRVTLRPSPFGGTTAIALVPTELVGVEEGYMEGLPAGMSAVSSSWSAGRQTAGDERMVPPSASRTQLTGGQPWGALTQGAPANGTGGPSGGPSADSAGAGQPAPDPFDAFAPVWGSEAAAGPAHQANGSGTPGDQEPHFPPADPFASQPYSGYTAPSYGTDPLADAPPSARPYSGLPGEAGSSETATGRPWPYDREPPATNGAGQPGAAPYTPGGTAGHDTGGPPPWYPQAESPFPAARSSFPAAEPPFPPTDFPSAQPAGGSPYPEPEPAAPAQSADPAPSPQAENPYPSTEESYKGLPKRVRQASLAPQLRDKGANRPAPAASGDSGVSDRSPEQIRSALSAIQRGWQEGRGSGEESPAGGTAPDSAAAGTPGAAADAPSAGEQHDDDQASTQSWPIMNATTPADHPADHPADGSSAGANGEGDGRTGNGGYADYSARPLYSDDQSSTERRGEPAEAEQSHRGGNDDS